MSDPITLGVIGAVGGAVLGGVMRRPKPPRAPSVPTQQDTAAAANALRRKLAGRSGYGAALMMSQPGGGVRLGPQRDTLGASMLLGPGGVREYPG